MRHFIALLALGWALFLRLLVFAGTMKTTKVTMLIFLPHSFFLDELRVSRSLEQEVRAWSKRPKQPFLHLCAVQRAHDPGRGHPLMFTPTPDLNTNYRAEVEKQLHGSH